jgi:hypothetical protein
MILCKEKFKDNHNVFLYLGDSGLLLDEIIKKINKNKSITFWLDGHYSMNETACSEHYFSPIKLELNHIKNNYRNNYKIIIDDMKEFNQNYLDAYKKIYPDKNCGYMVIHELEDLLKNINNQNKIIYDFDTCICYENKATNIKLIGNFWDSQQQLIDEFNLMIPEKKYKYKNLKIIENDEFEKPDYYIILNKPKKDEYYIPSKTIVFQMEPNENRKGWESWENPDPNVFMKVFHHKNELNAVQWRFKTDYNNYKMNIECEKKNKCCILLSSKNWFKGHKKRIELLKYIETQNLDLVDIYGKRKLSWI